MYFEEELSEEEIEEIIQSVAKKIHNMGMGTAAVLLLESAKPVSLLGAGMSRVFISPFLPLFGESSDIYGHKLLEVFEKRKNIERLIQKIEELSQKKESK